ncbi:hypothetical protein K4H28_00265 [Deefgea tanakiae]|uniref:Uncharacterized protein n=1 Tax=Deefgea tanakiae TaxID=2865840 RepID=A0ABX8Z6I0_9NEIS|nr:hypothetical protein [Deefgea tanakiae]QZA77912.1 hypothetical protein K4H28_00265 [Deefgea tanakiae]
MPKVYYFLRFFLLYILLLGTAQAALGDKDGSEPSNLAVFGQQLRQDGYDLELLISFGTSKGGSAGHLALNIPDHATQQESVYSANFYADRDAKHQDDFYTQDLILKIPKQEYLFKSKSSLSDLASFGLDFGEIYKRSVIGIRVYGVPSDEIHATQAYLAQMNVDFHAKVKKTEYHRDEIKYGYLDLNCAKTIASAFKYGAKYKDVKIEKPSLFKWSTVASALNSNLPTEMAMKLIKAWDQRGYRIDTVLYKKYEFSSYIDPHEEEKIAFKDLPDRFPSVLSRDFLNSQGQYQDIDNLYAMYLLYNLGRYSIQIKPETQLLEIETSKTPMPFTAASKLAKKDAKSDRDRFRRKIPFLPSGLQMGETPNNRHLYHYPSDGPH